MLYEVITQLAGADPALAVAVDVLAERLDRRLAVALVVRRGRMLMTPRDGRLLGGLWEPPGVELAPGADARRALRRALPRARDMQRAGRRLRRADRRR